MSQERMDPQTAYDVLVSRVYAPTFFKKLASVYGITPDSEEEAVRFLKIAGKLRNLNELEAVKTAGVKADLVAKADDRLDKILSAYGYSTPQADDMLKQAAEEALAQPYIREAAEVYYNQFVQQ